MLEFSGCWYYMNIYLTWENTVLVVKIGLVLWLCLLFWKYRCIQVFRTFFSFYFLFLCNLPHKKPFPTSNCVLYLTDVENHRKRLSENPVKMMLIQMNRSVFHLSRAYPDEFFNAKVERFYLNHSVLFSSVF